MNQVESILGKVIPGPVSYTHLRAHETVLDLVCRLLLEKKNKESSNARCGGSATYQLVGVKTAAQGVAT